MFDRESQQQQQQTAAARSRRGGRPASLAIWAAVVTVALVASFAAVALASTGSTTPTIVGAAANAKFGSGEKIVVDAHGRTLYVLSPETTHRLLCKSNECLNVWPPLTVHSRKVKLMAGPGVHGRLGILRRSDGMLQITLAGLPLYRFSGDSAKDAANGEGIKSFGGTWHVISAATDAAPAPAPTAAPTTPAPPTTTPTTTTPPSEPPPYYPPGY